MSDNPDNQVWLLSHSYLPARGGIENYLSEVSRKLCEKGYRPTVICRRQNPELAEEEEIAGVRVIRHPDFSVPRSRLFTKHLYLANRLTAWLKASRLCRDGWAICRYPHYQYALSSLIQRCPSLYLPGAIWPAQTSLASRGRGFKERVFARLAGKQVARLERFALTSADHISVFSRNMRSQVNGFYGIDPRKISINPPGVNPARFRPRPQQPELTALLNLPPGIPRILYLGRLSPEKNLIFLIRVLAELLKQNRALLLIVGDGPDREASEGEAKLLRCADSIRWVGATSEPEIYYSISDIFVSLSLYEPFGQNLIEAMASGLPVIALKSSPPRIMTAAEEIIAEGANGYTVSGEPPELRTRIEELLSSPRSRERMGQRGREICQERFSWERHIKKLLSLTADR